MMVTLTPFLNLFFIADDILSVAVPPARTYWDIISASADGSVKLLSISAGGEVYHFEEVHDRMVFFRE